MLVCSKGFAVTTIPISGMTGIIEMNDLRVNAARSAALELKFDELKARWLENLKGRIVQSLDNLASEEDLPARFGFIARVAQQYGGELLHLTALRWLTVVEPPGQAILISASEMVQRIASSPEVLVIYGERASPWTARAISRKLFPSVALGTLVVPLASNNQSDVGSFWDEGRVVEASLSDHFKGDRRYVGALGRPIFIDVFLQLVATAWG